MAVAIAVTTDFQGLNTEVTLTGLTAGTRYDVLRLQHRYLGEDDTGIPQYDQELPDRKALWSSVAHRVGWVPTTATATFRDYEPPTRPFKYFVIESAQVSPVEYDWTLGDYPLSRGVLDDQIVHLDRELELAMEVGEQLGGHLLIRSTHELGLYVSACVVEMEPLRYTARGTEFAVVGSQYPVYVADSREARRGSVTLKTETLGQFDDVRRIVFPSSGRIRPVIFNSAGSGTGGSAILLDDARVVPLDIEVEQATPNNTDLRFIRIDYVEVDGTTPLVHRIGDNDDLVTAPRANFSISDTTPARNQWITLTDVSTGQYDHWDWSFPKGTSNVLGKRYSQGPHKVRWSSTGKKAIKLRVYGPAGASTKTRTITVH